MAMTQDEIFSRSLDRIDAKLEEVIRRRREDTPENPDFGKYSPDPQIEYIQLATQIKRTEIYSDIENIMAPDVLLTELSFQVKQLLGVLPSVDQNSVDIRLLQKIVQTLWIVLNNFGLPYGLLRGYITGEPEEDVLRLYRALHESLTIRKRHLDLARVAQEMRDEDEIFQRRYRRREGLPVSPTASNPNSQTHTPNGFSRPASLVFPSPLIFNELPPNPTERIPSPSPARQTFTQALPASPAREALPASLTTQAPPASPIKQTRAGTGNRRGSRQPQRQSRPPQSQPPAQSPERRVLRPRGEDGKVKPPTEPRGHPQ